MQTDGGSVPSRRQKLNRSEHLRTYCVILQVKGAADRASLAQPSCPSNNEGGSLRRGGAGAGQQRWGETTAGPRSAPGCGEDRRTIAVYLHNKNQ